MPDEPVLPSGYFTAPVAVTDPLIAEAIAHALTRQQDVIELIASENIVSRAVLEVQGSILTNKTVEGYPGKRYHAGAAHVDVVGIASSRHNSAASGGTNAPRRRHTRQC